MSVDINVTCPAFLTDANGNTFPNPDPCNSGNGGQTLSGSNLVLASNGGSSLFPTDPNNGALFTSQDYYNYYNLLNQAGNQWQTGSTPTYAGGVAISSAGLFGPGLGLITIPGLNLQVPRWIVWGLIALGVIIIFDTVKR